jgi:hypothetical protein
MKTGTTTTKATTTQPAGHNYSDLIASRAWYDDDNGSWNLDHLWIYCEDGKTSYTTCDPDGNHEYCSPEDAASFDADDSWKEYNAWCAKHGKDPLGNFMVNYHTVTKETWSGKLRNWIGAGTHGLALVSLRKKGGKSIQPQDAPKYVRDYFCMKKRNGIYVVDGITGWDMLRREKVTGKGIQRTVTVEVERKEPRKQRDIAKDIRRIAASK